MTSEEPYEEVYMEGSDNGLIQGHTARMWQEGSFWKLKCKTCGWESTGCSLDEVRFDFRYHGFKTSVDHLHIKWNKLL